MQRMLDCAMDIGEQMLLNGAEVHRVEDSIMRICYSFGATRVDVFSITSNMIASIHFPDGSVYTETRRITSSGTDFHKLDKLNRLSRKICAEGLSADEIQAELSAISKAERYPFYIQVLAYAAVSGSFTIFFGGSPMQALISFIIGAVARFVILFSDTTIKNMIFSKFVSSFFITAMAFLFVKLRMVAQTDEIMIGNIMLLIPGITFTNAMRDLFTGDSIAGILRFLEAILGALAIAGGYFLFVFITGGAAV